MIPIEEQRVFIHTELDKLGSALGIGPLAGYAEELETDTALKDGIEEKIADVDFFTTKHWDSPLRLGLYRFVQYALARALKPAGIVETGVLHGLSTAFSLSALARNATEDGAGHMISIDYPSTFEKGAANKDGFTDTLPPGRTSGWAIPDDLRGNWTLRLGQSREELPAAVAELGSLGIFIHDSEHTYETMSFEFETVWSALGGGGILLADNIDVNTAFFDFARKQDRLVHVLPVDPDHYVPGASGIRCGIILK